MKPVTCPPPRSHVAPDSLRFLASDLEVVESLLASQFPDAVPVVAEMIRQGCLAGGKRFRPILLLLAARAFGDARPAHHQLAVAIEMIHSATLIHDDILDEALTRRHLATINARWGNHAAVLFGDFLFSQAFYLASTTGDAFACELIGKATNLVCEGELQQGEIAGDYSVSIDKYFEIIGKKTAALCACATQLGAHVAGGSAAERESWKEAGRGLGLAFQIVDDILDIDGDSGRCGKTLGTDLMTGTPTLPVLLALESEPPAVRDTWLAKLSTGQASPGEVREWTIRTNALQAARNRAEDHVFKAIACLDACNEPVRRAFSELGRFILARRN